MLETNQWNEIENEAAWLKKLLIKRSELAGSASVYNELAAIMPPVIENPQSEYGKLILKYNFDFVERVVLMLTLAPSVYPKLMDIFLNKDILLTGWGGKITKDNQYFLPTVETVMYVLAGRELKKRFELLTVFEHDHVFYKDNLLYRESPLTSEPELSGTLIPSQDLIDLVLRGKVTKPDFRPDFPAKLLSTEMDWNDVVLTGTTRSQLSEIELWILHNQLLLADPVMGKKLKPGFRALFYGPPGTGKTLSACLIGKKTGRDVYRVDLSTIVSKYIGETEKNLAKLFDRASRKDWILFFDEADALFGKRTDVNDSHDRYANQEVSYLLQRIEYHEGLVILATNMKNNIDSAFLRRFQSIVYFPMPKAEERIQLWKQACSETIPFQDSIDMNELASRYELSGSLISNIVAHTTLRALNEKCSFITASMLQDGIARELAKEGRTL